MIVTIPVGRLVECAKELYPTKKFEITEEAGRYKYTGLTPEEFVLITDLLADKIFDSGSLRKHSSDKK